MKIIAKNKKAFFDYEILDEIICGVVLFGHEVKSVRLGHVSLKGSFCHITNGILYLTGVNISQYKNANNIGNHDQTRKRTLLANKKEIEKMQSKIDEKGYTIVPTYIGIKGNRIKVKVGIAKGKKKYEKREIIKKKDIDREIKGKFKKFK